MEAELAILDRILKEQEQEQGAAQCIKRARGAAAASSFRSAGRQF
jgi:hypothetical protein